MLKRILLLAIGAAGALEGEKLAQRVRARFRPSAITGTLLDKANHKLEARKPTSTGASQSQRP